MKADMLARGIRPATVDWPERSKNWFYAHGGTLDPETRAAVWGPRIAAVAQRLVDAIRAVADCTFTPNREKDELTHTFGNPEHPGRTRGKGSTMPWRFGFADWVDTYRSRKKRKDEEAERVRMLEEIVLTQQVTAVEQEAAMEARIEERVRRQVELALSQHTTSASADRNVNMSPPSDQKQLRFHCHT